MQANVSAEAAWTSCSPGQFPAGHWTAQVHAAACPGFPLDCCIHTVICPLLYSTLCVHISLPYAASGIDTMVLHPCGCTCSLSEHAGCLQR